MQDALDAGAAAWAGAAPPRAAPVATTVVSSTIRTLMVASWTPQPACTLTSRVPHHNCAVQSPPLRSDVGVERHRRPSWDRSRICADLNGKVAAFRVPQACSSVVPDVRDAGSSLGYPPHARR